MFGMQKSEKNKITFGNVVMFFLLPFEHQHPVEGLGLARAASAMTSVSTVAHPADSCHGLPDAHAIGKYHAPKSKVMRYREYGDAEFVRGRQPRPPVYGKVLIKLSLYLSLSFSESA